MEVKVCSKAVFAFWLRYGKSPSFLRCALLGSTGLGWQGSVSALVNIGKNLR